LFVLKGVLEAAVNGGVAKYMDAFLVPSFIASNPNHSNFLMRLKSGIAHQVRILEGGLTLHGRLAPPAVRPLHSRLVERFTLMRAHIHQSNIDNRPSIRVKSIPMIIWIQENTNSTPLTVGQIYIIHPDIQENFIITFNKPNFVSLTPAIDSYLMITDDGYVGYVRIFLVLFRYLFVCIRHTFIILLFWI